MYIRISTEGSSKELAKLFKSIAEAFEETAQKETPEGMNEEKDEREG